jgi:hypothetical protein
MSQNKYTTDSSAAHIYRTRAAAARKAAEVAAALGTGWNRLGESGRGNVAVGCVTRGEYVVCVRERVDGVETFRWVAA